MGSAIQRDPYQVGYHLFLAQYEAGRMGDGEAIDRAFRDALALDPRNVGARIAWADSLWERGRKSAAAEQYRLALEQDDQLPRDEPRRLPPAKREVIEAKIQQDY